MSLEGTIGLAIGVLLVIAVACLVRATREYGGPRSTLSAVGVWAVYLLHLAIVIAASFGGIWPLAIPRAVSLGLGGVLLVGGVSLSALGMLTFGSVRRLSGTDTSRLVTGGIYAWCRNPQNVGWMAGLFGIALLGRSGLALVMAGVFAAIFLVYIRFEERHLESVFGDEYRAYLRRSHRILGLPPTSTPDFADDPASKTGRLVSGPFARSHGRPSRALRQDSTKS